MAKPNNQFRTKNIERLPIALRKKYPCAGCGDDMGYSPTLPKPVKCDACLEAELSPETLEELDLEMKEARKCVIKNMRSWEIPLELQSQIFAEIAEDSDLS